MAQGFDWLWMFAQLQSWWDEWWQAIVGAKEEGCLYYEVGEGFPNTSDEKLKGLTDFKSKFGGEVYRFYRGRFSFGRR